MPVTAKLSREFYDRFGDDVVNELVELLNRVDSEYRSELRQQNELNFARFDATLEQRVVQLEAKIDKRYAELDAKIDRRYAELDAKIEKRSGELDARVDKGLASLREGMATLEASTQRGLLMQSRWMLAGWAGVMIAILLK